MAPEGGGVVSGHVVRDLMWSDVRRSQESLAWPWREDGRTTSCGVAVGSSPSLATYNIYVHVMMGAGHSTQCEITCLGQ